MNKNMKAKSNDKPKARRGRPYTGGRVPLTTLQISKTHLILLRILAKADGRTNRKFIEHYIETRAVKAGVLKQNLAAVEQSEPQDGQI